MMGYHTLVVKTSRHNTEFVSEYLCAPGFNIQVCDSISCAQACIECEQPDIIILEIELSNSTDFQAFQQIRRAGQRVPILLLCHAGDPLSRLSEDELDIVDFLIQPFAEDELIARIRALLRRANMLSKVNRPASQKNAIRFDNIVIDINQHKVETHDGEIALTAREFDLLVCLASAPGRVFRRERLLDEVWGRNHQGSAHTVNTHVNRLRLKIEADPANPEYVKTVWGVGYKFSGQLRLQKRA